MNQPDNETICAIATPPGKSGVGVIRVSGPATSTIAVRVLGSLPVPRTALLYKFHDLNGQPVDQGIALFFKSPASYTGEDVLELQAHGGLFVLGILLQTLVECGARLARPGEFSERAFLNDKLDLAQLEAVADLIDASSEQAARSAFRTLDGAFSLLIHDVVEEITDLRVFIEAAIDFTEEEIDFLTEGKIQDKLHHILETLHDVFRQARQGALLKEGMHAVIAGQPNAGKSSLLNILSGKDSAIVTEIPGTTRDILTETINIDGLPVHIIDTAGLRKSIDPVELEGIRRARGAIERADRILLLLDAGRHALTLDSVDQQVRNLGLGFLLLEKPRLTVIFNKIDLLNNFPKGFHQLKNDAIVVDCINVSAKTGAGIDALRSHLKDCAGFQPAGEGSFIARQRHLDALTKARLFLESAQTQLVNGAGSELVAEDLRLAQKALGEITGDVTSDDLLGKIFASFCVGK